MQVNALDHFNVIAADLEATAVFYATVLGLERRNGPPPLTPANAQWMYDRNGKPIVHINTDDAPKALTRPTPPGPQTGAIHHIALNCSGHGEMLARLDGLGIERHLNRVEAIDLSQIFIADPNGVLLELNFFGEGGA